MSKRPSLRVAVGVAVGVLVGFLPTILPAIGDQSPPVGTDSPSVCSNPTGPQVTPGAVPLPSSTAGTGLIAFAARCHGNGEIFVVPSNGVGAKQLTTAGGDQPAWSRDGRKLAFVRGESPNRHIFVMNADGSGEARLTNDAADESSPSWSPDGIRIVFASGHTGQQSRLYIANTDGSQVTALTSSDGLADFTGDDSPSWSPATNRVVFARGVPSEASGGSAIFSISPDGTQLTRLTAPTTPTGRAIEPKWSPDGSKIAFVSGYPCAGGHPLWVMNADGTEIVNVGAGLTPDACIVRNPAFSSDGTRLIFSVFFRCGSLNGCPYTLPPAGLYSLNLDGSGFGTVVADETATSPDWSGTATPSVNRGPTTTTTTTAPIVPPTTIAPPPPAPAPPIDRYAVTSYDRMAPGAPYNGYFPGWVFQEFTAMSNRITYLGVTVGTPGYVDDGHTVKVRLCADSNCNSILAETNPQIVNFGNTFADIGDVAVNPGQTYFVVWYQPAPWHGQIWATYWWAGGNSIQSSDQMQALVKGFNADSAPVTPPTPPPANNYQIVTNGQCANVRTGPRTTFQAVACLPNGTPIAIECQVHGEGVVAASGQTSDIWDRLSSPNAGAYVTDILTNTSAFNAFSPGIPQCSGGPTAPPPTPQPGITIAVGQNGGAQRAGGAIAPAGSHWVIVDFHNFAPNTVYTARCIEDNVTWYVVTNLKTDANGNGHYTDTCFWGSANSPQVGVLASNGVLSNVINWPPAQSSPPPASAYEIRTASDSCANVRTGPGTVFQIVACLGDRTPIAIECQTRGGPASTSDGRVSYIWDRLSSPDAGNYVSDIMTNTPAFNDFSPGIPQCTGGPGTSLPTIGIHDCEKFVADVTVPDGMKINKGSTFVKTWRLQNCGDTNWSSLSAIRVSGSFGPSSFAVPPTSPGATADISVAMTAPGTTGHFRATYQLQGPRGAAGSPFWVDINVVNSGAESPPAPAKARAIYLALGDSYSSGEGAPATTGGRWLDGTDSPNNHCHRSINAYPARLADGPNMPRQFEFHACSGALIEDFFSKNHDNAGEPPQIDWVTQLRPSLITLTIGGNDASFRDAMTYCAGRNVYQPSCESVWDGAISAAILSLASRSDADPRNLRSVYRKVRAAAPDGTKILVAGYPLLFPTRPPSFCKTDVGARVFTASDMRWINSKIADMNLAILRAVRDVPGISYVNVENSFSGHELCTGNPWINGATVHPVEYSFHPNKDGQARLAEAFRRQL